MEEKKRMLDYFVATQSVHCGPFQEQWKLFRSDLGLPDDMTAEEVWEEMVCLPHFHLKGTLPKLSRWFSWNNAYEEQAKEFRIFRMLLCHWLGGEAAKLHPNDAQHKRELQALARSAAAGSAQEGTKQTLRQEFSKLKQSLGGGMKLAYHIMSNKLLQMTRLIAIATRPTWSWYSDAVKQIKSADDCLQNTIRLATSWHSDLHLQETAATLMLQDPEFVRLVSDPELGKFTDSQLKLYQLCTHLLANRAWSLAKQYSCPPDCYAPILGNDEGAAQASLIRYKTFKPGWRD